MESEKQGSFPFIIVVPLVIVALILVSMSIQWTNRIQPRVRIVSPQFIVVDAGSVDNDGSSFVELESDGSSVEEISTCERMNQFRAFPQNCGE